MKMILTAFININRQYVAVSLLFGISMFSFSQDSYRPAVESFESPATVTFYDKDNADLRLSSDHYWFGNSSLKWNWNGKSSFGTKNFRILSQKESPLRYGDHFPASPTLQMSIYSETPQSGSITIAFEKDEQTKVHFDIDLDFKGWRRIWVPFYEMKGNAPKKG